MRYIDVRSTSRSGHGGEEQAGRRDEAAAASGALVAGGEGSARSGTPDRGPTANGVPVARGARWRRDRCPARHEQGRSAGAIGSRRTVAAICGAARRSRAAWVQHAAVDAEAGPAVDRAGVRRSIQRGPRLAPARATGALQPEARSPRPGTRCCRHRALAQAHLAGFKKAPDARED